MEDAELARLEHENMVVAFERFVERLPGSLVQRTGGVTVVSSRIPVSLFNQVLVSGPDATMDDLRAAVTTMRGREAPWIVNLRAGTDDGLVPMLRELGLVAPDDGPTPGMALHPIPADLPAPTHDIRVVRDGPGVSHHAQVIAEGFGMPPKLVAMLIRPETADLEGITLYVGYLDGRPITSGLGMRTGRTIGVYNIATVPDARRRGFGAEMTARVAADGLAAGCDVAILQASTMGYPVYERMGYRTVVTYTGWSDPA
jgi:N-acetylglutamate synthase